MIVLGAIDAADFAATVYANVGYRPGPGMPTVMPLSQLMGWITSVSLLVVVILLLGAVRNRRRDARGTASRNNARQRK